MDLPVGHSLPFQGRQASFTEPSATLGPTTQPEFTTPINTDMMLMLAITFPALISLFCGCVCYVLIRAKILSGSDDFNNIEPGLFTRQPDAAAMQARKFDIESIPSFLARDEDKHKTCVICLENLETEPVSAGECGHTMHTTCLKDWLAKDSRTACPVCRHTYESADSFRTSPAPIPEEEKVPLKDDEEIKDEDSHSVQASECTEEFRSSGFIASSSFSTSAISGEDHTTLNVENPSFSSISTATLTTTNQT